MRFNTTTDYAIRLLLYLANVNCAASFGEIAKEMNIPLEYITAVAAKLEEKSYIQKAKDPADEYYLACHPNSITLGDVAETVEDNFVDESSPLKDTCDGIKKTVANILKKITIQDLTH